MPSKAKPKAKARLKQTAERAKSRKRPVRARTLTSGTKARIRDDLPKKGKRLLKVLLKFIRNRRFLAGSPETYLGYKECCALLGLIWEDMNVPWGRYLQREGLTDLNEWTVRHKLPAIGGLIV